jgi:hypothetical protein
MRLARLLNALDRDLDTGGGSAGSWDDSCNTSRSAKDGDDSVGGCDGSWDTSRDTRIEDDSSGCLTSVFSILRRSVSVKW